MFLRNAKYDFFLLLILILLIIIALKTRANAQIPEEVPYGYQTTAKVARVIDGDTFVLSDSQRVRFIGVDTPELKSKDSLNLYYANESKSFVDSTVNGKVVKLTFETETRDLFNRILAYVWLTNIEGKDSLFLQAELLKKGYARIRYYPVGSRYYDIFYNLRRTAMKKNLGIWSR
jgi:micrococcal nuclease